MPSISSLPQVVQTFGMPKEAHYVPANKVTNTSWLHDLKSLTKEAVASKLFGSMTVDKVMQDIFQDLKEGACYGYQQALSFDRQSMSIEEAFKKNCKLPERPCLLQICEDLKHDIKLSIECFSKFCKKIEAIYKNNRKLKTIEQSERPLYKTAIMFWKKHHVHHCSDPKFTKKLQQLFRKHKRIPTSRVSKHATIDTLEKIKQANAIVKRVSRLKEKILGGKAPKPIKRMESGHQRKLEKKVRAWRKKYDINEIDLCPQSHIFQLYPGKKYSYAFDITLGLAKFKNPEKKPDKAPHFPALDGQIFEVRIYGKKK